MRTFDYSGFRCPVSGDVLVLNEAQDALLSPSGRAYQVVNQLPILLTDPIASAPPVTQSREYYRRVASEYDAGMDWLFGSFFADEDSVRAELLDQLDVGAGQRVLEVGCGTGRDVARLAELISPGGRVYATDLSEQMLRIGLERLEHEPAVASEHSEVAFSICDVNALPFPDSYFDAAFHFGGLNLFADRAQGLAEMARVVKTGGRVVAGDEGVAPWLRDTEYGAILKNSNPLYAHEPPTTLIPAIAEDVSLRWILGNAFYVLSFRVADAPPSLDLNLPIPGARGGTHRTRYFGQLEGVDPELRTKVQRAAEAAGQSVSDWLGDVLRQHTER